MNTMKKNGGFTLVELIIVIAILAILSTGAIAGYSAYIKSANNTAVQAVLSDISTSAVLANAEAGGITSITVKESTTAGKLEVTVTFDTTKAPSFEKNFVDSLKAVNVATGDSNTDGVYTIDAPNAWKSSDYAKANNLKWESGAWTKVENLTYPAA